MPGIFELHVNEVEHTKSMASVEKYDVDGMNVDSKLLHHRPSPPTDHRSANSAKTISQQDAVKAEVLEDAGHNQRLIENAQSHEDDSNTCNQRSNWRHSLPPPTRYRRQNNQAEKSFQPVASKDPMMDMVYHCHRKYIFSLLVEAGVEIASHMPADTRSDTWDNLFTNCTN